jgi:hypothetical protein
MRARNVVMTGTAALCCVLASCGGSNRAPMQMVGPPPPPPSMTKDLDTAAVLAIVQTQTSETADPFEVDNAAVAVTPQGDETSAPINVDAT